VYDLVVDGKADAMAREVTHSNGRDGAEAVHIDAPAETGDGRERWKGPRSLDPRISIVIPAKNEARNLPQLFAKLPTKNCEVILVDGASTDDTVGEALRLRPDVNVISQTRIGKGNALACGFAAASGDFIVMIDADGSNDPSEIPRFVDALRSGADFAKGSRFLPGGGSRDISRFRKVGNFWLNRIVNLVYGTRYTDLCYGYNAFRRECLSVMALDPGDPSQLDDGTMRWGDGFEVETLINVRIAKAGLRVSEVPSFEAVRNFGTSNLNAFSDGMRVLHTIRVERHRSPIQPTTAESGAKTYRPSFSPPDEEVS
jgi:glycosyltransferase involved in cell wall biosynthesis